MKRFIDISCSFLGLVLLLPLFIVIGILIRIDSSGPVLYKQQRIGKNFTPFFIYKFRTMIQDADKKGSQITAGGDARVTRVGKVLRKTKVDELPQLINVLKGEMSLVGPRPEVEKYVMLFREDYEEILKIRPGITDISSITYRDEEGVLRDRENPGEYYRTVLLPQKIRLAREYIMKSSTAYDLKLMLLTIMRIFFPAKNTN